MNEVKPALTAEEWLEYVPLDRTLAHHAPALANDNAHGAAALALHRALLHWAYMLQCAPGDAAWQQLPGTSQSVPAFLEAAGLHVPEQPPIHARRNSSARGSARRDLTIGCRGCGALDASSDESLARRPRTPDPCRSRLKLDLARRLKGGVGPAAYSGKEGSGCAPELRFSFRFRSSSAPVMPLPDRHPRGNHPPGSSAVIPAWRLRREHHPLTPHEQRSASCAAMAGHQCSSWRRTRSSFQSPYRSIFKRSATWRLRRWSDWISPRTQDESCA